MGTWGTAIFSDDFAADIKAEWRGLIGDGVAPQEATERILADHFPSLADPAERGVLWLALAVAQWSTGRLIDSVRDAALEVIDSGADAARWDTRPLRAAREKVLAKTREQLLSPQPPAKKIPKVRLSETPFRPGDLVSYVHGNGTRFLFWVFANQTDNGGEYSHLEVLDFVDPSMPGPDMAARLPAMERRYAGPDDGRAREPDRRLGFILVDAAKIPSSRVAVIGSVQRPEDRLSPTLAIVSAKELDDWLRPFLPGGDQILRRLSAG